jgi:hypothetical protein
MSSTRIPATKARPAPVLVLCRQCLEYVFAGTDICPHCGNDARAIGPRYRDGGHEAIEALQRIERVLGGRAK